MPEITYRKLKDLKLLNRNPREINDRQFQTLCTSLQNNPDYFEARPLILSDRTGEHVIIAGNMRHRAAKKIGLKEVPTILLPGLTEEREREIVIRDNVSNGSWDWDVLSADWEVDELADWGLDVPDFEAVDDESGDADAEPQTDKAAELNKKWKVKRGDLWQIGEHRLVCGDSTSPQDVERVLDGAKPNLMVTDPPYGVNYDPSWRAEAGINKNQDKMGKVTNDDNADWTEAWLLSPSSVAYVWHAGLQASIVQASLEIASFELRSQIVWAKDRMALSRGDYHWKHEPCWYAVRKGETSKRNEDRTQTTLWEIVAREDSGHGHGTQKPLECMARPIRNHEGNVYEPFAGSGTTLVACQNLNRKCYAIEISENYCAVILERMQTAFPDIEIKNCGI